MPKGVHVVADLHIDAEFLLEVTFSVEALAHETFGGGQVAVGLFDPASHNFPAAFRDIVFDALVEAWIGLLHPSVDLRGSTGEAKVRLTIQEIDRGLQGGHRLRAAILPRPEPDGIEVSLADQV